MLSRAVLGHIRWSFTAMPGGLSRGAQGLPEDHWPVGGWELGFSRSQRIPKDFIWWSGGC